MTATTVLLVGLGAALGAPLRYLADAYTKARSRSGFPWGTFAVNVVGSFVLGAVTGGAAAFGPQVAALVGTGFCGALTTYSTFGHEIVSLAERRAPRTATVYLLASVLLGVLAAAAGWALVRLLLAS